LQTDQSRHACGKGGKRNRMNQVNTSFMTKSDRLPVAQATIYHNFMPVRR
jgi:hypothetical protein